MKLRSLRRRLQWPVTFVLARLLLGLVQHLPLRFLRWLGRLGGDLVHCHPGLRRISLANIRVAFPDWDDDQLRLTARRAARHMVCGLFEFTWFQARPERLPQFVTIPPAARDRLLQGRENCGRLAFSPHLGNWELGNLALNQAGIHTAAVARKQPNPYIQRLIEKQRTAAGGKLIWEKGAARGILNALKQKELVMILVDQNTKPHEGGVFVEFFGLPAAMSRAPAMFARRTGADLILTACIRQDDGTYQVVAQEMPRPMADYDDDEEICRDINRLTEDLIRRYPDQYIWMYGRYRYIPPDWPEDHDRFPFYSRKYQA